VFDGIHFIDADRKNARRAPEKTEFSGIKSETEIEMLKCSCRLSPAIIVKALGAARDE